MTPFIVDQNSIHYITGIKIIKNNRVLTTEAGWEKGEGRREKREERRKMEEERGEKSEIGGKEDKERKSLGARG
jgi:hypothetical protein